MTDWKISTIGTLFNIGGGKQVTPTSKQENPKSSFLRTANIFWGKVNVSKVDSMFFTKQELEKKNLIKGDLLVCEGGDIGRSAIWNEEVKNCSFQNHLHRLRPNADDVCPRFYMYYLQAGFTQLGIYEGAGNKTTIPNLSKSRLAALEVPKPSFPEQQKIAVLLWKVQQAIELQDNLISTTTELKQSAMEQLFTKGLRGEKQKETEIGLVPESSVKIKISDLGTVITGSTPRTSERKYYNNGVYHFIAPGDIGVTTQIHNAEKTISESGLTVSRVIPKYSTCFVCIGSSIGKVGITTQDISTTNQQINTVVPSNDYDKFFVCYLLKYWSRYISFHSSPSPVPIMSKGKFQQVTIYAIQDKDKQTEIAMMLKVLDDKIEQHMKKKSVLSELFQSLLNQLMTGKICVADLDIDISEIACESNDNAVSDHFADISKMVSSTK